jgi:uncharacterized protein
MTAAAKPKIDSHVHLAGVGSAGSGCWMSPAFRRRWTFRLLRLRYGITPRQMRESADADWAAGIAARVRGTELDHAVVLGFDGVYGDDGRRDDARSQMVVPPEWVFEVCRRHPELLPGPSVNPGRADAMARLEYCIDQGAVLLKWLPATMGIDPADRRHLPFYRRMADAGLPLLIHSGGSENTFAEVAPALKDLRRVELPLETGVTVIVAHTAAPVGFLPDEDQVPLLRVLLARYPHLWVDNSGMSNPSRFRRLPGFASDPVIAARTLHGSDFPVPANAFWYAARIGAARAVRLDAMRNRMQRDIEIKRALGYPDTVLTRAADILPNLPRWTGRSSGASEGFPPPPIPAPRGGTGERRGAAAESPPLPFMGEGAGG